MSRVVALLARRDLGRVGAARERPGRHARLALLRDGDADFRIGFPGDGCAQSGGREEERAVEEVREREGVDQRLALCAKKIQLVSWKRPGARRSADLRLWKPEWFSNERKRIDRKTLGSCGRGRGTGWTLSVEWAVDAADKDPCASSGDDGFPACAASSTRKSPSTGTSPSASTALSLSSTSISSLPGRIRTSPSATSPSSRAEPSSTSSTPAFPAPHVQLLTSPKPLYQLCFSTATPPSPIAAGEGFEAPQLATTTRRTNAPTTAHFRPDAPSRAALGGARAENGSKGDEDGEGDEGEGESGPGEEVRREGVLGRLPPGAGESERGRSGSLTPPEALYVGECGGEAVRSEGG